MDGPRDYHHLRSHNMHILSEVRQRQISYHLYVKPKKIQINLFVKQKETHRHTKQIYGYQRRKGRMDKLGGCY